LTFILSTDNIDKCDHPGVMYHTTEGWQWSQGHLGMLLTLFDKENLFIKVSYEQELSHHASTIPLLDGGKNNVLLYLLS